MSTKPPYQKKFYKYIFVNSFSISIAVLQSYCFYSLTSNYPICAGYKRKSIHFYGQIMIATNPILFIFEVSSHNILTPLIFFSVTPLQANRKDRKFYLMIFIQFVSMMTVESKNDRDLKVLCV